MMLFLSKGGFDWDPYRGRCWEQPGEYEEAVEISRDHGREFSRICSPWLECASDLSRGDMARMVYTKANFYQPPPLWAPCFSDVVLVLPRSLSFLDAIHRCCLFSFLLCSFSSCSLTSFHCHCSPLSSHFTFFLFLFIFLFVMINGCPYFRVLLPSTLPCPCFPPLLVLNLVKDRPTSQTRGPIVLGLRLAYRRCSIFLSPMYSFAGWLKR
jgi:hypothetical protein